MKRGQITLFITLGIILIISIILGFYLYYKEPSIKIPEEFIGLNNAISECVKKTAVDSIYFVSIQGGYYEVRERYEPYFKYKIPLRIYNGNLFFIEKDKVAYELKKYFEDNFYSCINFNSFNEQGYNIKSDEVIADVSVDEEIYFKISPGIVASKGESSVKFPVYDYKFDFNYKNLINIENEVMKQGREGIPLDYLSRDSTENNYKFDILTVKNDTYVYILYFNNVLDENPLALGIGAKYGWK